MAKDDDLKDVMAEEGSRGRRRPIHAVSQEQRRQIRKIARMIDDPSCDLEDYLEVIREKFGLEEGSAQFLEYVSLWGQYRGK